MKKTIYQVEFPYYQYNSGCADNGIYTGKESFEDVESAEEFKEKIDKAAAAYKKKDFDSEHYRWGTGIVSDMCYGGFIDGYAKIFKITKETVQLQ